MIGTNENVKPIKVILQLGKNDPEVVQFSLIYPTYRQSFHVYYFADNADTIIGNSWNGMLRVEKLYVKYCNIDISDGLSHLELEIISSFI